MADGKELDRLYELMENGFRGVHSRLDALNGRTRENEEQIARQDERLKAISVAHATDPKARWGTGLVAGAVAIVEVVKQVFGK